MQGAKDRAWGSETPIRSCRGAVVLVDQAAEQVPATNTARVDRHGAPGDGQRWSQADGTMRSLPALSDTVSEQRCRRWSEYP